MDTGRCGVVDTWHANQLTWVRHACAAATTILTSCSAWGDDAGQHGAGPQSGATWAASPAMHGVACLQRMEWNWQLHGVPSRRAVGMSQRTCWVSS